MSAIDDLDPPTPSDGRALRAARSRARRRMVTAEAMLLSRTFEAFREELGATVRSVSPVLFAFLGREGVDRAAEALEPVPGWPIHPRIGGGAGRSDVRHTIRHWFAAGASWGGCAPRVGERARTTASVAGGQLFVHVVNHSVEMSIRFGRVRLETAFGVLRIELIDGLPATLLAALPGRPVEDVFGDPPFRGRGWTIAAVESDDPLSGPFLVVATGASPYALPWAR